MHEHIDINRMIIRIRKPLPEIRIPRQAVAYLPRTLKTAFVAKSANRSLARTLCFSLLALSTSTLDGLRLFPRRSCRVDSNIGFIGGLRAGILFAGRRCGLVMRREIQVLC
jgi:hypothetical protein